MNGPRPPDHADALRQSLAAIASALGTRVGTPYLITYDYTESGATQRCAFICHADNVRAAAEYFWNQHPGEWFHLIGVNDGSIEAYWQPRQETFVTIPEKERELE